MIKEFVCGFMFSENKQNILLIKKDRPEWQNGLLNGVGGKLEEYEPSELAMVREFKEEVGINTTPLEWTLFAVVVGTHSKIFCYKMFSDKLYNYKQMETEEPTVIPARDIWIHETVPNLNFLVPMARDSDKLFEIKIYE